MLEQASNATIDSSLGEMFSIFPSFFIIVLIAGIIIIPIVVMLFTGGRMRIGIMAPFIMIVTMYIFMYIFGVFNFDSGTVTVVEGDNQVEHHVIYTEELNTSNKTTVVEEVNTTDLLDMDILSDDILSIGDI